DRNRPLQEHVHGDLPGRSEELPGPRLHLVRPRNRDKRLGRGLDRAADLLPIATPLVLEERDQRARVLLLGETLHLAPHLVAERKRSADALEEVKVLLDRHPAAQDVFTLLTVLRLRQSLADNVELEVEDALRSPDSPV